MLAYQNITCNNTIHYLFFEKLGGLEKQGAGQVDCRELLILAANVIVKYNFSQKRTGTNVEELGRLFVYSSQLVTVFVHIYWQYFFQTNHWTNSSIDVLNQMYCSYWNHTCGNKNYFQFLEWREKNKQTNILLCCLHATSADDWKSVGQLLVLHLRCNNLNPLKRNITKLK